MFSASADTTVYCESVTNRKKPRRLIRKVKVVVGSDSPQTPLKHPSKRGLDHAIVHHVTSAYLSGQ